MQIGCLPFGAVCAVLAKMYIFVESIARSATWLDKAFWFYSKNSKLLSAGKHILKTRNEFKICQRAR